MTFPKYSVIMGFMCGKVSEKLIRHKKVTASRERPPTSINRGINIVPIILHYNRYNKSKHFLIKIIFFLIC
jgi:hypothetical protein